MILAFHVSPINSPQSSRPFRLRTWHTTDVFFADATINAFKTHRDAAQVENTSHLIALHRHFVGHWTGHLNDGSTLERRPGGVFLLDCSLSWQAIQHAGSQQTVFIDKAAVGLDHTQVAPVLEFSNTTTTGASLLVLWDEIYEALRGDDQLLQKHKLDQFLACVRIGLGTPAQRDDVRRHARAALFRTICKFIEANLNRLDLGVDLILANFGVSRASLYRMFENRGGVRNYIMERRTVRAVIEIAEKPAQRGQIHQIAEKWGFSSQPNFNRAVKQKCDAPPSALFDKDWAPIPDRELSWQMPAFRQTSISKS